jgi:uncharacterized protein (TIGR03086 family)
MLDLEPAAREVVRLLEGITDDRLADPTRCADRSVAALLDHLMGLSLAFTWAAHKTTTTEGGANPGPGEASAEHLDPGWRTILPRRLLELVEAWRDPKAWQGVTEAGGVRMPAEQMSVVALDELVLHGWDLARATGQFLPVIPPAWTLSSRSPARPAQPEHAASREGLFGPVVDVPEDAPAFDRALGFARRDPGWTPMSA